MFWFWPTEFTFLNVTSPLNNNNINQDTQENQSQYLSSILSHFAFIWKMKPLTTARYTPSLVLIGHMPFLLRFLAQRSHYSQDPSGVGQFPAETRHFKMFNLWKVLQIFSLQTHKFQGSFYVTETKACTPHTCHVFIHSFILQACWKPALCQSPGLTWKR